MTEADDLTRCQAELLAAFSVMREDLRMMIRAKVGHDLEFVLVAWDRTRVVGEGVPTVYQTYTLTTQHEALATALAVLTKLTENKKLEIGPAIDPKTLN